MRDLVQPTFGISPKESIKWRIIAWVDGLIFLGLLFLAIVIKPIWLAALVFLVGLFASAGIWVVVVWVLRPKRLVARKIPKG